MFLWYKFCISSCILHVFLGEGITIITMPFEDFETGSEIGLKFQVASLGYPWKENTRQWEGMGSRRKCPELRIFFGMAPGERLLVPGLVSVSAKS